MDKEFIQEKKISHRK